MDWIDLTQGRDRWPFRFHNTLRNPWVTAQVAPSRERLGSTELVQYSLRYVETGIQEILFFLLYVAFVLYPLRQEVYAILRVRNIVRGLECTMWERHCFVPGGFFLWSCPHTCPHYWLTELTRIFVSKILQVLDASVLSKVLSLLLTTSYSSFLLSPFS